MRPPGLKATLWTPPSVTAIGPVRPRPQPARPEGDPIAVPPRDPHRRRPRPLAALAEQDHAAPALAGVAGGDEAARAEGDTMDAPLRDRHRPRPPPPAARAARRRPYCRAPP